MSVSFEEAKAYLQSTKIYDHVSEVLLKIITEKPINSPDLFEHISTLVKQQKISGSQEDVPAANQAASAAKAKQITWATNVGKLFDGPAEGEDSSNNFPAQDLVDEASMLEWAGVGFGREETFALSLSLSKLAQRTSASGLRFWGKVLGRTGDYYVAEALSEEPTDEIDTKIQEGITGVNKHRYWAMPSTLALEKGGFEWIELPPVTVQQIVAAKSIRKYFTGNPEAPVSGHPPFPGVEKNLLRAQIARISASTVVCPAGLYVVDEEGAVNDAPAEEVSSRSAEEFQDLASWVHKNKEVNQLGRTLPLPPSTDEEGNEIEDPNAPPVIPSLRALNEDADGSWISSVQPKSISINPANRVAVLKSLQWPGAFAIGYGKRYTNVYVGFGLKYLVHRYSPPNPLPIQKECTEEMPTCVDVLTDPNPPADEPSAE